MKHKGLLTSCILSWTLIMGFLGVEIKNDYCSRKLSTTKELAEVIKEEESHFSKLDTVKEVYWTYGITPWGTACSEKIRDNVYLITLDKRKTRNVIRHELYHIYAGHCDSATSNNVWSLRAQFHDEFTARVYATYNLKL